MSYYKETIPELIERLKTAVSNSLDIIDSPINEELSDDKLHNVLKARRMAVEDVEHFSREIERLQNTLNGVEADKKKKQYLE